MWYTEILDEVLLQTRGWYTEILAEVLLQTSGRYSEMLTEVYFKVQKVERAKHAFLPRTYELFDKQKQIPQPITKGFHSTFVGVQNVPLLVLMVHIYYSEQPDSIQNSYQMRHERITRPRHVIG